MTKSQSRKKLAADSAPAADDAGPEVLEAELEPDGEDELAAEPDGALLGAETDLEEGDYLDRPQASLPQPTGVRDSLNLYLREVSRFPMLRPEEEHELAVRCRDHNDPDAAFRLVSSHLRLVVRIAMDFQRRWMQNVLDLVQEGNVGLLRAVNKFDPDKGIKFSYYASFWIKAYILKFIMDNWRMVKIGTTQVQRKLFYNLNRERQKLIAQGFDPDAAMLSERLGVSVEQIAEMDQRLASTDLSLNVQVGEENGSSTRMDFLPALGPAVEEHLATSEITELIRSRMTTI
ncbi:MAG: sigma-70 family RNA polymerase sigma factor, partial [Desulfovibrio sp.]|nr:sigma-70 family RNA polymerase sigma factor [Desulfovibrio sp.]